MEIKPADMKLLQYAYSHAREPISKIAKALKLTRDQVEYKLRKFEEEGLIKKYMTIFNYQKLGYDYFVLFIVKFRKNEYRIAFERKLKGSKNCISHGRVWGKYDVYANMIFKDEKDFKDKFPLLFEQIENGIIESSLIKPFQAFLYPLKAFDDKLSVPLALAESHHPLPRTLDKNEIRILQMFEKDNRVRIVDIANTLNISSELALYKIRKLIKERIILGSRIQFDMSKLDYFFSGILITLKTISQENVARLRKIAQQIPTISSFVASFNSPNIFIQIIHKDQKELRYAVEQIQKALQDTTASIEIVLLTEEDKINTLPFIEDLKVRVKQKP